MRDIEITTVALSKKTHVELNKFKHIMMQESLGSAIQLLLDLYNTKEK